MTNNKHLVKARNLRVGDVVDVLYRKETVAKLEHPNSGLIIMHTYEEDIIGKIYATTKLRPNEYVYVHGTS